MGTVGGVCGGEDLTLFMQAYCEDQFQSYPLHAACDCGFSDKPISVGMIG